MITRAQIERLVRTGYDFAGQTVANLRLAGASPPRARFGGVPVDDALRL
ncbi:MAG: hypothetical protein H6713_23600 [Myxococcales bacterium]|nr:hypothetical protein [Myxococcales bacterium]MCB9752951.1 hypothetical protein [Myxococcales bacterium]